MDVQRAPLLSWAYFLQGKNMEELRHSLLCTTLELEQTKLLLQEELRKRDDQLVHLKDLLSKAIKERDEANEKFQKLVLEKLLIQQTQQQQQTGPLSGISSIEDEPRRGIESNNGFSSSDSDESIVSSPTNDPIPAPRLLQPPPQLPCSVSLPELDLAPEKLPEKGKFLQAVMKAGPLLQTLLLAGPLPQWRHPPPPLESFEIPPVTIPSPPPPPPAPTQLLQQDFSFTINGCNPALNCGRVNRKRAFCDDSNSPTETKFQRLVLN